MMSCRLPVCSLFILRRACVVFSDRYLSSQQPFRVGDDRQRVRR